LTETNWHRKVVKTIREICGSYSELYKSIRDGNTEPIVLSRRGTQLTCNYRPDVIADHRVGFDVYEVVDSETVNEAVANILQFLAARGHCNLRMFCSDPRKGKRIEDMARVILFNLRKEEEFEDSVRLYTLSRRSQNLTSLRKTLRRIINAETTAR
jgi:hypothetical protein